MHGIGHLVIDKIKFGNRHEAVSNVNKAKKLSLEIIVMLTDIKNMATIINNNSKSVF
ncbi:hypothetical protein HBE96_07920 [Clostridium sp. P21]|uniref:Uncharacterized protein n=1 Tax=Clostridium muellerianum TaxID=2716538 RepID=A0A7Y0EHP2_9CLOT|nr:hypothetical protein [Clostridium muellerianum]NMM62620.1 hypothetical protein [Clostridium muellerianum]